MDLYNNNYSNSSLNSTIEVLEDDLKRSYHSDDGPMADQQPYGKKVQAYERRIHSSSPRIPHSAKMAKAPQHQQRRASMIDVEKEKREIMSSLQKIEAEMDLVAHEMEESRAAISNEYCYYYQLQQDKKKIERKLRDATLYGMGLVSGIGIASPFEKLLKVADRDIRNIEHKVQTHEDRLESLRIDMIYLKNEQKKQQSNLDDLMTGSISGKPQQQQQLRRQTFIRQAKYTFHAFLHG